jgi:hypothetical protein
MPLYPTQNNPHIENIEEYRLLGCDALLKGPPQKTAFLIVTAVKTLNFTSRNVIVCLTER